MGDHYKLNFERYFFRMTVMLLLLSSIVCEGFTADNIAVRNIYVAGDGNDWASGDRQYPVATFGRALEMASAIMTDNNPVELHIILHGATYYFPTTAVISSEAFGNPDSSLIIEAFEGEKPVLSGALPLTDWTSAHDVYGLPEEAVGKVLVTETGSEKIRLRQMWVNGKRARKASNHDGATLQRIICRHEDGDGIVVPALSRLFSKPQELEVTIIQDWAMNILRLKSIVTENGRSFLKFENPEAEIEFKRPWPILRADETSETNHFFKLSNAIELLDNPDEWYHDLEAGKLYYFPAAGMSAEDIRAEVPRLATLIAVRGTKDRPVQNVAFKGITFSHSSWLRPAEAGHVALQAGLYLYDAYTKQTSTANNVAWVGRPDAAVDVYDARNVSFIDCRFELLGSTGLDFREGVKNSFVRGCVFNDVGGNAIMAGYFGDENFEVHQPWNPSDNREVCEYLTIDNNYIAQPGVEDWGCLAIAVGFASNVTISHNEIFDTPYSAINVGWGWVKDSSIMCNNHIVGNYIHSFSNQMRDSGAIYTLSSQPGSSIVGNRIEGVGDPPTNPVMWPGMKHSQFDLYTDEGTDYYTVSYNWAERGEISRNQNGPHNIWGQNGPSVSEAIRRSAGLQEGYRHLPSTVEIRRP